MQSALSHSELLHNLSYSIVTGHFYWLKKRNWATEVGSIAGALNAEGYRYIKFKGKSYSASLLAFFYLYGRWSEYEVDHKNRIKDDNSWLNLREATSSENSRNSFKSKGQYLVGVFRTKDSPNKLKKTFGAQIQSPEGHKHLGVYYTELEAHEAYKKASVEYFGEFSPFYKEPA